MTWNREVIPRLKGPQKDTVFAENQRQKTRKVSDLILNVLFLPFQTGTAMENLDVPIPDLTEEQQGERSTQRSELWLLHTAQQCLPGWAMSQWNLFPLKTHPNHLFACKRETSSQFPALSQAPVRLCAHASGNLDTWRRLYCALNEKSQDLGIQSLGSLCLSVKQHGQNKHMLNS